MAANKRLYFLLGTTVLILGLVIGLPRLVENNSGTSYSSCDLNQGPCELEIDGQPARLSLAPIPVRSATPLTFTLELGGQQPERVWLDLQGAEMYMGINQSEFQKRDGLWIANTELAVCTTGTMLWRARITLEERATPLRVELTFEAR